MLTWMAVEDWERSERGLDFAIVEGKRFLRRARSRLAWLVLVGVLAGAAYSAKRANTKRTYEGQIVMRIVEADKDLTDEIKPPKEYLNAIWGVFLSGPHLKEIIERYQLFPDKYERDPQLAVEALRSDLDVVVWRNYFSADYWDRSEARSARFSVTWTGRDPELVLKVVRALGQTIIDTQTEERRAVFELGQQDVRDASENAIARLGAVRAGIALRERELLRATLARTQRIGVELRDLRAEEKTQQRRLDELTNARTRFDLTAAWEREHAGIRFEVIEAGIVLPVKLSGPIATACTSLVIALVTVLFGGLILGAFDTKIRQGADVRRLGVTLLGEMPQFKGDTVGALTQRLRAEDQLRLERR